MTGEYNELVGQCNALREWFISQEIEPGDGMIAFCAFTAEMIVANSQTPEDIERKIRMIEHKIRVFIALGAIR